MSLPEYMQPAIGYIDNWLENQTLLDQLTPGYSVAISCQGKIIYSRGFGYANVENKELMTPDHLFRIASHSKTFTAVAIMQLMDNGKLSIYDEASKYLPFLNENPDERVGSVTIQEMLQHTSGMWRDGDNPTFWRLERDFPSKEEVIAFYKKEPLVIDNNTRFKYSNYAYALLGWIIEEVSGQTYVDYMRDHILKPLGLSKIAAEYDPENGPYITGYTSITPGGQQAPISAALNTAYLAGATGFCSNAESICTFYDAVMPGSGKLMSDKAKREMLRRHWEVLDMPGNCGYGLGFKHEKMNDRHLSGHSGGMPGNITRTLFDSDDRIVVSVLSNCHAGDPVSMQKGIWHIIDKFKTEYSSASPFLQYQGQFYDIFSTQHFVALGDKIYITLPITVEPFKDCSELEHIEGNLFKIVKESGYGSYGQTVEFIMDGDIPKSVNYAGFPKLNKDDYEEYVAQLKNSAA